MTTHAMRAVLAGVLAVFFWSGCGGHHHHSGPLVPTITTASTLPDGFASETYSATLSATGGVSPLTWSLASGSTLPTGISLNSAGVLSGTPTSPGTFTFTLVVTGRDGGAASLSFTVTFGQAPPTITTSGTLPGAFVGTAYSVTFAASGGVTPITWSLASGSSFPPGVASLSASTGTLSGTPITGGTFNFSMTVTGNNGASMTTAFSLTVTQPNGGILYVTSNAAPPVTWRLQPANMLTGAVSPTGTISGSQVQNTDGRQLFLDATNDRLWYTNENEIDEFTGNASQLDGTPTGGFVILRGANTQIKYANGVALDLGRDVLYVTNSSIRGTAALLIFHTISTRNGDVTPTAVIAGNTNVNWADPQNVFLDTANDRLYVCDQTGKTVKIWSGASQLASGDVAPTAEIKGASTTFVGPYTVSVDTIRDILYIGDLNARPSAICVYAGASTLSGAITRAPDRRIVGTGVSADLGDSFSVAAFPQRDELYVACSGTPGIIVFSPASTATGDNTRIHITSTAFTTAPNTLAIDTSRP